MSDIEKIIDEELERVADQIHELENDYESWDLFKESAEYTPDTLPLMVELTGSSSSPLLDRFDELVYAEENQYRLVATDVSVVDWVAGARDELLNLFASGEITTGDVYQGHSKFPLIEQNDIEYAMTNDSRMFFTYDEFLVHCFYKYKDTLADAE